MGKPFLILLLITLSILTFGYGRVEATPITPTDFDSIDPGQVFAGPLTGDFITSPVEGSKDVGDATNIVYFKDGLYTYTESVTPQMNNISEFNTGFSPQGWNGVAGFSFSQANTTGVGSGNINISQDPDGTIDWNLTNPNFDSGETITFFFQSTLPPGLGVYNLIDHSVGATISYAPTPEPTTLLLLSSGLLGLAGLRRKLLN